MAKTKTELADAHGLPELHPDRIGRRLRIVREALGLKPSQIADALGIERTYWSRFENGIRPVTPITAALLRQRFGVPLGYIILGEWAELPHDLATKMRAVEQDIDSQEKAQ